MSSGDERILESHRRDIAVLFCDLRGFTAFAESAEPEEVMALLHDYHAALATRQRVVEVHHQPIADEAVESTLERLYERQHRRAARPMPRWLTRRSSGAGARCAIG